MHTFLLPNLNGILTADWQRLAPMRGDAKKIAPLHSEHGDGDYLCLKRRQTRAAVPSDCQAMANISSKVPLE